MLCVSVPPFQAALQEPERAYLLAKARGMVDGARVINKCPAAAEGRTRGEAKRKRVEAAPHYLKGRVERDEELPEVEVKKGRASSQGGDVGGAAFKQEELRAVVMFVVKELKAELVVELLQALKPRWSQQGV